MKEGHPRSLSQVSCCRFRVTHGRLHSVEPPGAREGSRLVTGTRRGKAIVELQMKSTSEVK